MAPVKRAKSMVIVRRKSPVPSVKRGPGRPKISKIVEKRKSKREIAVERTPSPSPAPAPAPTHMKEQPTGLHFPFETLVVEKTLDATVSAVHRAVTMVLDDHVLRCTIPIQQMATICKNMQEKLQNRRAYNGIPINNRLLDEVLNEVLDSVVENDIGMNKSVFKQELIKYVLISSAQFDKLSTNTLLSVVQDLWASEQNLVEFEAGYPAKVVSSCHKFFDLTPFEMANLQKPEYLKLTKEYVREALRYNKDAEEFLNAKHKELVAAEKTRMEKDKKGGGKISDDAERREYELAEAYKKNARMGKHMRDTLARLLKEEEDVQVVWEDYRSVMLKGNMGVRSEEDEKELYNAFKSANPVMLKALMSQIPGKENEGEEKKEAYEVFMENVPSRLTRSSRIKQVFVPTPNVYHSHEV